MAQCPNCHSEVKPDERFCGNCGARLEPAAPPPERPRTGKETVVLPPMTDVNLQPPPAPKQPAPDATILGMPPSQPPSEPTIIGMPPAASPPPTTPLPPPQVSGYPAGAVPPAPPQEKKSGGNVWKVLAIVAGVGVLACIALAVGVVLLLNSLGRRVENVFPTISAGLAETSVAAALADPTAEAISGGLADPTAESLAEPTTSTSGGTGAVVYDDNFDDPSSSALRERSDDSAAFAFANGTYEISVTEPQLIVWEPLRGEHGDAAIAVDTAFTGSKLTAAGVIFHFQDNENFYIFTISSDGRYALDLYKDNELNVLIDPIESPAIKISGEMNALRVETVGSRIRLYANDQLLDEVSDSTFARGKAALAVSSFEEAGVSAAFDNLVIQRMK
jgi:hypothetical protein